VLHLIEPCLRKLLVQLTFDPPLHHNQRSAAAVSGLPRCMYTAAALNHAIGVLHLLSRQPPYLTALDMLQL
jgi:hypothetical protein